MHAAGVAAWVPVDYTREVAFDTAVAFVRLRDPFGADRVDGVLAG